MINLFCNKLVSVFSPSRLIHLCLVDSDYLSPDSSGVVLSQPPFAFVTSTRDCELKIPLLFYPFHLCLIPYHQPVRLTFRRGKGYHDLILKP